MQVSQLARQIRFGTLHFYGLAPVLNRAIAKAIFYIISSDANSANYTNFCILLEYKRFPVLKFYTKYYNFVIKGEYTINR